MLFGKLRSNGFLTDISAVAPTVISGESVVQIATAPIVSGPFVYDAVNKLAVPVTIRTLLNISADITSLSASQKTAIWSDLTSGSPAKILASVGPNAGSLFVFRRMAILAVLGPADSTSCKVDAAAMYVQDNPAYLVRPAFDATINISGVQ